MEKEIKEIKKKLNKVLDNQDTIKHLIMMNRPYSTPENNVKRYIKK